MGEQEAQKSKHQRPRSLQTDPGQAIIANRLRKTKRTLNVNQYTGKKMTQPRRTANVMRSECLRPSTQTLRVADPLKSNYPDSPTLWKS